MTTTDIFGLLHEEHKRIKDTLASVCVSGTQDRLMRVRIFGIFKHLYHVHVRAEERSFYCWLQTLERTEEALAFSQINRTLLEGLLIEMEALPICSEEWLEKMMLLQESITEHVEHEERFLFPLARKCLSGDKCQELARDFLEHRNEAIEEFESEMPSLRNVS